MADTLIESLHRLRAEEAALIATLARARASGGAQSHLVRCHRRLLAQIRSSIEERLPQAIEERERIARRIGELRGEAGEIRRRLDEVRLRAGTGKLRVVAASRVAGQHQAEYERILKAISQLEYQLGVLAEFLPEAMADSRPACAVTGARESGSLAPSPVAVKPCRSLDREAAADWSGIYSTQVALLETEPARDGSSSEDAVAALVRRSAASGPVIGEPGRRERRRRPRFAFGVPMKYRTEGLTFPARSVDISSRGMFIATSSTVPVGSMVTAVFSAEGYPVEIEARVVFESPGVGMGVMFTWIPDLDRSHFESLIFRLQAVDGG